MMTTPAVPWKQIGRGLAGTLWTTGHILPTSPNTADLHLFDRDVESGLVWRDSDGITELVAADLGDVARRHSTFWRRVANLRGPMGEGATGLAELMAQVEQNTAGLTTAAAAIDQNSADILGQATALLENTTNLARNTTAIEANTNDISLLRTRHRVPGTNGQLQLPNALNQNGGRWSVLVRQHR